MAVVAATHGAEKAHELRGENIVGAAFELRPLAGLLLLRRP